MNEILLGYYEKAVERSKTIVLNDINQYLETKETLPSFEQYVRERGSYLNQVWWNVWINTATSKASLAEKNAYLTEKGYDLQNAKKKMINQLFRTEIRNEGPFDILTWLEEKFLIKKDVWEKKYQKARKSYFERKALELKLETERKLLAQFDYYIDKLLNEYYKELYIHIRYVVGSHLALNIQKSDYPFMNKNLTFLDYLQEASDWNYQTNRFEENIDEQYERFVLSYLFEFGTKWVKQHLPPHLTERYSKTFNETLSDEFLEEATYDFFVDLSCDFFTDLLDEYVSDLVRLSEIPFDLDKHREIYYQDLMERERKEFEKQEAIKRKKEEEARMIQDIFGIEYDRPPTQNIRYVLHVGETNTGKTFQAIERMKAAKSGIYLAPLRLLAHEIYDKLNEEGVPCSLKTGEEEKIVNGATHLACTVEMFHEKEFYEVVVIDEGQMIADENRGFSWYKAISKANAKEVHIICSFNAKEMLLELLGDSHVEVNEYNREIPLEIEKQSFRLKEIQKGDALVCFSRRRVLETASDLQKKGIQVSVIYGSMPPETRKKQIQRFIKGETTVIVATDAIGMGLNLPIRRIIFLENEKFDGIRRRRLTSQEVKQIAGRAGRKGIYDVGKVVFTSEIEIMARLLEQEDKPLDRFVIAPTSSVLERFQKYSRDLGLFFDLWDQFNPPQGMKKAKLSEEKMLYSTIRGTNLEAKLSLAELYGFLHLPFSTNEPLLRNQWKQNLEAIVAGNDLPEPIIKDENLEELELSYKSIGLHLLFLYKLGKITEAHYWERIREELSDRIHDRLKSGIEIPRNTCKNCGKILPPTFKFSICDECYLEHIF